MSPLLLDRAEDWVSAVPIFPLLSHLSAHLSAHQLMAALLVGSEGQAVQRAIIGIVHHIVWFISPLLRGASFPRCFAEIAFFSISQHSLALIIACCSCYCCSSCIVFTFSNSITCCTHDSGRGSPQNAHVCSLTRKRSGKGFVGALQYIGTFSHYEHAAIGPLFSPRVLRSHLGFRVHT